MITRKISPETRGPEVCEHTAGSRQVHSCPGAVSAGRLQPGHGAPSFAGNSNNLRVSRDTICCSLCTTSLSPSLAKLFSLFPGRVGSPLSAIACTRELSSVKRSYRPEKDFFLHPSASLHSRIWISAGGRHTLNTITFTKTPQCLWADLHKTR